MCGIAALISLKDKKLNSEIIPFTQVIAHRGPNDEGYALFSSFSKKQLIFGSRDTPEDVARDLSIPKLNETSLCSYTANEHYDIAFGHRRLSILDLSPHGHQPMMSSDGRLAIVFNGEVYNYIEIREELIKLGYTFHSQSDTEVILNSYLEWGEECLHKFNGMFTFILYDKKESIIFAARDRFGVKPLYYYENDSLLGIASEIKQFSTLPSWKASLNHRRAYDFLLKGFLDHTPETFFSHIHQIPAGHYLKIEINSSYKRYAIKQWYQLEEVSCTLSFEDAAEKLHSLLLDAVNLRLRSDVAVGSCLSGGIDSSSIVCLMHELLQKQSTASQIRTFTAKCVQKELDETKFAQRIIDHTHSQSHFVTPKLENLFTDIDKILWHQDEPFCSTSVFAQWEVFSKAKQQNTTVILDGQGADETLAGYKGFYTQRLLELLQSMQLLTALKEWRLFGKEASPKQLLSSVGKHLIYSLLPQSVQQSLSKAAFDVSWLSKSHPALKDYFYIPSSHSYENPVKQLSLDLVTRNNLPKLLHYEDRNSMAHSIESRTPFVDYRVIEYITSLPSSYKIRNGETKVIIKHALKEVVPPEIFNRKDKIGFATAEQLWVCKENPALFKKLALEAIHAHTQFFNTNTEQKVLNIIEKKAPFDSFVWRVIVFDLWAKRFGVVT